MHHLPVYYLARICSDHTHLKGHRPMHPGNSMRLVALSLNDYISPLPSQEVRGMWCRSYSMCISLQPHWGGIFTWNSLWWMLPTVKVSSRQHFLMAHPGSPESWMIISFPSCCGDTVSSHNISRTSRDNSWWCNLRVPHPSLILGQYMGNSLWFPSCHSLLILTQQVSTVTGSL